MRRTFSRDDIIRGCPNPYNGMSFWCHLTFVCSIRDYDWYAFSRKEGGFELFWSGRRFRLVEGERHTTKDLLMGNLD